MIDVTELMTDPDFASPYTVMRTTGKWIRGRFLSNAVATLKFYGPVQPATVKEIEHLSSGDQVKGVMKFFCKSPKELFLTRDLSEVESADDGAASDLIFFHGGVYEVIQVMPWGHFGWYRAFATLKGGVVWRPA